MKLKAFQDTLFFFIWIKNRFIHPFLIQNNVTKLDPLQSTISFTRDQCQCDDNRVSNKSKGSLIKEQRFLIDQFQQTEEPQHTFQASASSPLNPQLNLNFPSLIRTRLKKKSSSRRHLLYYMHIPTAQFTNINTALNVKNYRSKKYFYSRTPECYKEQFSNNLQWLKAINQRRKILDAKVHDGAVVLLHPLIQIMYINTAETNTERLLNGNSKSEVPSTQFKHEKQNRKLCH